MTNPLILDVTKDVKWIGILDPDLRVFDIIMETKYGTTYNSYFIHANEKTIIETAKEKFSDEYLEKVKAVVNPEEIKYIVLDHTEPDHSGSLGNLLEIASNATVVGSGNALRYLKDITGLEFKSLQVKDGDTLDLGNKKLRFIGAPNLHWPDSIFTYLEEDKLLFTCDSFGAHFCDDKMFDDLVENYDEAFRYYFDVILKPYSKFMLQAIQKISGLEINAICPGHGPILRSQWKKYVDLSSALSRQYLDFIHPPTISVFIPYVSAYGYTSVMAENIAKGVEENPGITVVLKDIRDSEFGTISELVASSSAYIIGSPTFNQNILPQIFQLFFAFTPVRDRGKAATAFGSYGWSGEGISIIEANLRALKLNVIQEGLRIKFTPHEANFAELKNFGKEFGRKLLEMKSSEA